MDPQVNEVDPVADVPGPQEEGEFPVRPVHWSFYLYPHILEGYQAAARAQRLGEIQHEDDDAEEVHHGVVPDVNNNYIVADEVDDEVPPPVQRMTLYTPRSTADYVREYIAARRLKPEDPVVLDRLFTALHELTEMVLAMCPEIDELGRKISELHQLHLTGTTAGAFQLGPARGLEEEMHKREGLTLPKIEHDLVLIQGPIANHRHRIHMLRDHVKNCRHHIMTGEWLDLYDNNLEQYNHSTPDFDGPDVDSVLEQLQVYARVSRVKLDELYEMTFLLDNKICIRRWA